MRRAPRESAAGCCGSRIIEHPVKPNRFINLGGADKSVNRALKARARDLAGL